MLVAIGIGSIMTFQSQAAEQPSIHWRMQALWTAGTTPYKFEEKFVQRVGELTGGHFKIKLFSAGQIVPAAKAFTAVRAGAFQLMKTYDGYEAGKIPAFAFTGSVPFAFTQPEQFETWFYKKGGLKMVRQVYAKYGLYYIAPAIYGPEPIHSKFPINKLSDLKGKKGRFVGLASSVMADLGVVTTPISTAEVYQALDKGVIDIADRGDLTANYEVGLADVAKYILYPGFHQPTTATSYVANQKAYSKLPPSYKEVLNKAALETSHALRDFVRSQDKTALVHFREKGVTIITPSAEEMHKGRAIAEKTWKRTAGKDKMANEILDSEIAYMKELGLFK